MRDPASAAACIYRCRAAVYFLSSHLSMLPSRFLGIRPLILYVFATLGAFIGRCTALLHVKKPPPCMGSSSFTRDLHNWGTLCLTTESGRSWLTARLLKNADEPQTQARPEDPPGGGSTARRAQQRTKKKDQGRRTKSIRRDLLHCCCDAVELICAAVDCTHQLYPSLPTRCGQRLCCDSLTGFLSDLVCLRLDFCARENVFWLASTKSELLDRGSATMRDETLIMSSNLNTTPCPLEVMKCVQEDVTTAQV